MSPPSGYHGRCLLVDVTTGAATPLPLDELLLRSYLGGAGLGTALLRQFTNPAALADPLHPSAPLLFVFSPLVGSPLTTSAKFAVVAQSPLTFRINDSLSSSHFAIAGKRTGFDAICLVGRAARPSLLQITDSGVELLPAEDLWGLTIPETERRLRERSSGGFRAAVIGPAGEQLVRYATISHDGRHAGRGGHGAVLGSKLIKAVLVRGSQTVRYAAPAGLVEYARELSARSFGPATAKYRELGTVSNLLTFNRLGALPTRNFQSGEFLQAEALAPEALATAAERTRASCAACTIGCEHIFPIAGQKTGVRMEYENLFALGPLCGISDSQVVLQASALCDELGLDTISTGGTIAFAMECAERGLMDAPEIRFGAGEVLLQLIRQIASRTGWGKLLAEGSRRAAGEIGQGSAEFAPHVKGLEIPGYEPRALQTMALGFAVGTRGADHNRSGAYQVDFSPTADRLQVDAAAVARAIEFEDEAALFDSLILCKFLRGVFADKLSEISQMLQLVTGWKVTPAELTATARRIVTARKRFNISAGWTPAEDTLPARFFQEQLPTGASAGAQLNAARLEQLKQVYYSLRGWDARGYPATDEEV